MKKALLILTILCLVAVGFVGVPPVFAAEEVTINHTDHGNSVPLKAQINEPHLIAGFGYDMPNLIGLQNSLPVLSFLFNDSYLGFEANKKFMKDPFWPSTRSYFEDDLGGEFMLKVTNYTCIFRCPKE